MNEAIGLRSRLGVQHIHSVPSLCVRCSAIVPMSQCCGGLSRTRMAMTAIICLVYPCAICGVLLLSGHLSRVDPINVIIKMNCKLCENSGH